MVNFIRIKLIDWKSKLKISLSIAFFIIFWTLYIIRMDNNSLLLSIFLKKLLLIVDRFRLQFFKIWLYS